VRLIVQALSQGERHRVEVGGALTGSPGTDYRRRRFTQNATAHSMGDLLNAVAVHNKFDAYPVTTKRVVDIDTTAPVAKSQECEKRASEEAKDDADSRRTDQHQPTPWASLPIKAPIKAPKKTPGRPPMEAPNMPPPINPTAVDISSTPFASLALFKGCEQDRHRASAREALSGILLMTPQFAHWYFFIAFPPLCRHFGERLERRMT